LIHLIFHPSTLGDHDISAYQFEFSCTIMEDKLLQR